MAARRARYQEGEGQDLLEEKKKPSQRPGQKSKGGTDSRKGDQMKKTGQGGGCHQRIMAGGAGKVRG